MSSFVCSKEHFKKVRDLTYYLIKCNKHFIYRDDVKIINEDILRYVNHNIYELLKLNVASVNYQYNDTFNLPDEYYQIFKTNPIEKDVYNDNTLSTEDLIGLYNAYKCINYQIELDYNKTFITQIKLLISDTLMYKLQNQFNNVNNWEYTEI